MFIVLSHISLSCTGALTIPDSGHIKVMVTPTEHYVKVTITPEHSQVMVTIAELRMTATPVEHTMVLDLFSLETIIRTPTGVEP